MEEHEAIARARKGDLTGLEVLVARYQVRAVRTAYLIVRDRQLAEDIVQQAFIRAYERIGQLDPERPFAPWFLRSVANDAIKAVARGRRLIALHAGREEGRLPLDELLADPRGGPAEQLDEAERSEALWQAIGRLPAQQRAAIVLRYFAGLSDAEIAAKMASPPPTIRWRLHAARQRLRELLGNGPAGEDDVHGPEARNTRPRPDP